MKGDKDPFRTGRWLIPRLRDACPWAHELKSGNVRCLGRLALTAEGLEHWKRQNAADNKGPKGQAKDVTAVNQLSDLVG
jgi:hypothetical protein